jgi:hypothetical protein
MFVGGPNARKDYHLEEGEEVLFISKLLVYSSLFSFIAFLSS